MGEYIRDILTTSDLMAFGRDKHIIIYIVTRINQFVRFSLYRLIEINCPKDNYI